MPGSLRRLLPSLVPCLLALIILSPLAHAGDDWLPITPDELKMTSEPKAAGAMAIYLYRQVDRNDAESRESHYARIKIFTEEGRKYADIEIPFVKNLGNIKNIQARTIHPDGTIINFDGKVFEKTVVKAKGIKYLAKTFTMPDVQPGSIIEYRYLRILPEDYLYDSRWLLSEELFTKHAKFSLHQAENYTLQWSWPRGLPPGTNSPAIDHRTVRLETYDIPAFQIEDYMPPQDEMKYRVDFMYTRNDEKNPDKFWREEGKNQYHRVEAFIDKRKAMEQAVEQTVSPNDTPEQKLQKIYARCQKIQNTTFEREKSQQEKDRERLKEIQNVEDVWKRGYGNGGDIDWLFLAMARAAGFDASPVLISTRDEHFFNRTLMNPNDLNTNLVLVKLNGKDLYFDPGVAFAPYAILPWEETAVPGMLVTKDGATWITTSAPDPAISGVHRDAALQLDDSGSLEGKVIITYKGISALRCRLEENEEDAAGRKKFLEDELKDFVPVSIEAELTNQPDWSSSSDTLVAEFHLKVPGWASAAGRRTLLPAELFGGGEKHLFDSANRVHPIYFHYTFTDTDNVSITLPPGLRSSNVPKPQNLDLKVCAYGLTAENDGGAMHISRRLMMNIGFLDTKFYGSLRNFFQTVRTGDEQPIVLAAADAAQ